MSKLPLKNNFPLGPVPLLSRLNEHELNTEQGSTKNYKMLAFRPGYALQASELNEMQEHFYMQMSLTINMITNWVNNSNLLQSPMLISGPGWVGTTPLYPGESPHGAGMKQITNTGLNIQFRSGWYLTELVNIDNSTQSGLKFWVYLDIPENDPAFKVSITQSDLDNGVLYVGLNQSMKYFYPIGDNSDDSLFDNSPVGNTNPNSAGAGRVQIGFVGAGKGNSSDALISRVLKINTSDRTIRYMNNVLLGNY